MQPLFAQFPEILGNNPWLVLGGGIILLVGVLFLIIFFSFLRLWIRCFLTGARISIWDLVGMKLRNVDYPMIVRQKIALVQAGVKVTTRDLGEMVEVKVRDNGTGIPADVRAKLFQPFFTTKPTGEGTGLGLSISYDIVTQQHGGTIEVESEPGSFTEFTVRLPRSRRVATPAESAG